MLNSIKIKKKGDQMQVNLNEVRKVVDESGYIESGAYRGFYLLSLLIAMDDSAWDYPSAMIFIGGLLSIQEWIDQSWSMRPSESTMYDHLKIVCPDINWSNAPNIWST